MWFRNKLTGMKLEGIGVWEDLYKRNPDLEIIDEIIPFTDVKESKLSDLSIKELRKLCKEKDLIPGSKSKDELIEMLEA